MLGRHYVAVEVFRFVVVDGHRRRHHSVRRYEAVRQSGESSCGCLSIDAASISPREIVVDAATSVSSTWNNRRSSRDGDDQIVRVEIRTGRSIGCCCRTGNGNTRSRECLRAACRRQRRRRWRWVAGVGAGRAVPDGERHRRQCAAALYRMEVFVDATSSRCGGVLSSTTRRRVEEATAAGVNGRWQRRLSDRQSGTVGKTTKNIIQGSVSNSI